MSTPISLSGSRHLGPTGLFAPSADPAEFGLAPAPRGGAPDRAEQTRTAASQLVASTFIKPILKQAREMNDAPAPFGPTQAEKQFGAMLDNKIADDIARSMDLAITARIARNLDRPGLDDNQDPGAEQVPGAEPGPSAEPAKSTVDLIG